MCYAGSKTHQQLQFGFAFIMYVLHVQSLVRRMVWKHHFTPSSHDLRQQNCLPVPSSGHPWPRHHAASRDWICCAAVPIIWYPQPHRNQLRRDSIQAKTAADTRSHFHANLITFTRHGRDQDVNHICLLCVVRCNRSPSIYNPLFPNHESYFAILAIV